MSYTNTAARYGSEEEHLTSEKMELDVLTMQELFGVADTNLKELERSLEVSIITRDGTVEVQGEDEQRVH